MTECFNRLNQVLYTVPIVAEYKIFALVLNSALGYDERLFLIVI